MLDSALRSMATALLLIFLIPRWLKAVINKNTHNLIYVNLKGNVTYILHLTSLSNTFTCN
jgi:hypothetical protein